MVKAGFFLQAQQAYGFEQAQGAHAVDVGGVLRALEAYRHMTLRAEVVDLIGLYLADDAGQVAGVAEVAIVQLQACVIYMRVLVDVINALGVERAGAAFDAVHLIAFFKQQFGQVGAILAGDASDECNFGSGHIRRCLVVWRQPVIQLHRHYFCKCRKVCQVVFHNTVNNAPVDGVIVMHGNVAKSNGFFQAECQRRSYQP